MWRKVALAALAVAVLAAMTVGAGRAQSTQVSLGTAAAASGDAAFVPLVVSPDPAAPLGALVVRVSYGTAAVASVSLSSTGGGVIAECDTATPGQVRCALAHATGMSGFVLVLRFQVRDSAPPGIVPLTLAIEQCFTVGGEGAQCAANNGALLVQAPSGPPPPPSLVAIHPLDIGRAFISWQPPTGVVTFYRLRSALNFEMTFAVNQVDVSTSSLGGLNLLVVGVPTADKLTFYYQLAACNSAGCSSFVRAGGLARRIWPSAQDWNFYLAAYDFMGVTAAAALNASPMPGKESLLFFYDGIQGLGGTLQGGCGAPVPPLGHCGRVWPSGNPFASAAQSFPPFGEVGAALRVR